MKKVLVILLAFLLIALTGCSENVNPISKKGKVKVYDYTESISAETIATAESISVCEDVTIVFADEYIASRHLGNNWVIVVMPTEITVHHSFYNDETCESMGNTVAKASRGLNNEEALLPIVKATAKKARGIAIEEAAYSVFMIGFVAFLAMTFIAGMISDRVPSNSFAGRVSGAFLGFAVGLLASGRGSHKSSSFGGSSGGSATVRR